jgi:hypothetical protein
METLLQSYAAPTVDVGTGTVVPSPAPLIPQATTPSTTGTTPTTNPPMSMQTLYSLITGLLNPSQAGL